MTIWSPGFDNWGKIDIFASGEVSPLQFDIVIPKTPLYEGMVVWILK